MKFVSKLTITRLILASIFLIFLSIKNIPYSRSVATVVFIAATAIDFFYENFISSKNKSSKMVVFINALIDKILVTTALIYLVEFRIIPSVVAIVVISIEFAISGLVTLGISDGLLLAKSTLEKVKTVFQMTAIILFLSKMSIEYNFKRIGTNLAHSALVPLLNTILYVSLFITIVYAIDYFIKNKQYIRADR